MRLKFKYRILLLVVVLMTNNVFSQDKEEDIYNLSLIELSKLKVKTASKRSEEKQTAPATIYIITEADILRYGYQNLQEVLEVVPSVYLSNPHSWIWGGQRGFLSNFSQTLLMINSREVNNLIAFEGFISKQFATNNIKQIEVMASPGSALYGANALVGVINIITKDGDPDFEGIEVHADAGSFNSTGGGFLFSENLTKDLNITLNARYSISGEEDFSSWISNKEEFTPGWADKELVKSYEHYNIYENPSRSNTVDFRLDFKGFYGGMNYYYNRQSHGQEKATWAYQNQNDNRDFRLLYGGFEKKITDKLNVKIEQQYLNSKFWGKYYSGSWPTARLQSPDETEVFEFGSWSPNSGDRAGHAFTMVDYNRNEAVVLDQTTGENIILQDYYSSFAAYLMDQNILDSNNITKDDLENYFVHIYSNQKSPGSKRYKTEVQFDYSFTSRHLVSVGYTFDKIDYVGLVVTDAGSGIYSTVRIPVDEGKREDVYTSIKNGVYIQYQGNIIDEKLWLTFGGRFDNQNHYGSSINPRSGIIYKPYKSGIIKALYGEAYREGNVFELTGQPNLEPAKMRSIELNYAHHFKDYLYTELVYYHNNVSNFLGSVGSLIGEDVESVESQTVSGLETLMRFQKGKISAFASGSYLVIANQNVIVKDKDTGFETSAKVDLLSVPDLKLSGGLSYKFHKKMGVSVANNYVGSMNALGGSSLTTIPIDAYNDVSITLFSENLQIFKEVDIQAFITVKNLLDAEYYHPNIRRSGTEKFLQNGRYIVGRIIFKI